MLDPNETMKIHEAANEVISTLRAQVAQLTLERDGCRDLIATLRSRVAEMELNRLAPPADGAEEKATDAP